MKILLVEDDASTAQFLSATLTADQYAVDVATDGQLGLELAKQWEYDLIVLDVMIPKLDGISVCRQLRSQDNQTPILLLTARGSNQDVVTGLDAGADDYLTKPFDLSQLLARIRALLRRRGGSPASLMLAWGDLTLDMVSTQVMYQEKIIDLRPREYRLLELFLRHPLRVFSRNAIIDQIWTSEDFPTEGAVTNLIKDLRQRLKRAGVPEELIETVYGLGYRLRAAPDQKPVAKPAEKLTEAQQQGLAAIAQAQEWFEASLEQRIENLAAIEQALQQGMLSLQQRQQGMAEAHKLVGGLGTFGYAAGVVFARRIEALLAGAAALEAQQVQEFSQQLAGLRKAIDRSVNRPLPDHASTTQTSNRAAPDAPETAVIVLSSEAALAQTATELLQPWGIQVIQVTHPDRFWPVLTTITPELLLLDADAADLDSLEFCQTVRRDPTWNVPIVLLTTEANPELIQAIFAAGVDDFIRKPMIEPEFVSRVVHRIERLRPQKSLSPLLTESQQTELDALTQLVNRRSFLRLLQQTWMQPMPLALILCDLDQFTQYNERYGPMAGDACLQQIASLLQQSTEGMVARYGGDEFAILLFNTSLDQAVRVAQTIQQAIRSGASSNKTEHPAVTVSLGITGTTPTSGKSVETLLTTAAQALYAAKWRGGNTYCLYS